MSQETERLQARVDQLEQKVSQLEKEISKTDQTPVMLLKPPPVAYNIPRKMGKESHEETDDDFPVVDIARILSHIFRRFFGLLIDPVWN